MTRKYIWGDLQFVRTGLQQQPVNKLQRNSDAELRAVSRQTDLPWKDNKFGNKFDRIDTFHFLHWSAREMTKRGALLHGVPYGVPKMEYP